MKKIIFSLVVICTIFSTTSCSTRSGKVGNIDMNDITYKKDPRSGLCFGLIGAKTGGNFLDESTALGAACVPCKDVEHLLE